MRKIYILILLILFVSVQLASANMLFIIQGTGRTATSAAAVSYYPGVDNKTNETNTSIFNVNNKTNEINTSINQTNIPINNIQTNIPINNIQTNIPIDNMNNIAKNQKITDHEIVVLLIFFVFFFLSWFFALFG